MFQPLLCSAHGMPVSGMLWATQLEAKQHLLADTDIGTTAGAAAATKDRNLPDRPQPGLGAARQVWQGVPVGAPGPACRAEGVVLAPKRGALNNSVAASRPSRLGLPGLWCRATAPRPQACCLPAAVRLISLPLLLSPQSEAGGLPTHKGKVLQPSE